VKQRENDRHLSAELMQGFLDGEVSPKEAARVQEHTASCARCRSELDAWQTLFSELGELADVGPSPSFRERVLHSIPAGELARVPVRTRVARWVRGLLPESLSGKTPSVAPALLHPTPERLQDFLEGLLPRGDALGVEGHLHVCRDCRVEVEGWRGLLTGLGALESFGPSPEFSERVMAHVRVQLALVVAEPSLAERMQLLVGSVTPRTKKRVAALAGAGLTPAVTLGLLAYTVFSHPLVTLGNLFSFAWLEGSERLGSVSSGLVTRTTQSETLFRVYQTLDVVLGSPATAALAITGLAGLTFMAMWVFYRNVLAGTSHAH
jgi:anti-sigma factor RsiW